MWSIRTLLLCLMLLQSAALAQSDSESLPIKRYLYVVTPGIRDYLEFGGAGILVFDIDDDHKFVKRIQTSASKLEKPRNIKGVCASAITNRLYFTTPEKLYCVDLATEETLWEVAPDKGCDRMSISPDGKILYVPSFEKETWNVIDAMTGKTITVIETNNGAHNTVVSLDGARMYMGGLKSPKLFVADTNQHKLVREVGPFGGAIRPFTVNGFKTRAFICVNDLLGFEIGDLTTGKKLHRVEVAGFKPGPVKRHGCPSHGVGLTPDEREIWVVDAANQHVHIFDNTVSPPRQLQSIPLREQPGWITFSRDGIFAYPSTGEVIDTKSKKIVQKLSDEQGREVHSEKMIEIHMAGNYAVLVGDQFGVGRQAAQYRLDEHQKPQAAYAVNLPHLFTPQCYSDSLEGSQHDDEAVIRQALTQLLACHNGSSQWGSYRVQSPVLKLNFVVANEKLQSLIPSVVSQFFPNWANVPTSSIVGELPNGAAVGVDAVALYDLPIDRQLIRNRQVLQGMAKACPAGPRVYISGQAEKGATPAEAAAQTIAGLKRTLEWLGCETKDAVQAKCFLTPMAAAQQVRAEFDKVFGIDQLPLVFVEWKSDLPVEIELIAHAPPARVDAAAIEFLTPPDMTASPVYSRVVRVNRGNWIYTAGLTHSSSDANEQVVGIFDQLLTIFNTSDSDFAKLAKATYYVTNDATSKSLNELRPQYYDPKKPPAASKAMIPSLGEDKNVHIMVDMIGVSHP
jgi:enamine deaminase RidA (YjgF/YER057c/UK114 family)/DNA-binding beta-propeller fold protein YncE